MSDQNTQAERGLSEAASRFLPDPDEIPRTVFWCACVLGYASLVGLMAGQVNCGFVVGLGAACGLAAHRIAVRRDWGLRTKVRRR